MTIETIFVFYPGTPALMMHTMKMNSDLSARLPSLSAAGLLALMACVFALNACQQSPPGADPRISGLLRQTQLPGLPSQNAQPLTRYMGKSGLLLVFVDSTCPFSQQAMKDLPVVAPALAAYNIPTVLISLDDGVAEVRSHYADQVFGVPILYDVTTATKLHWNIQSVPTVVFISANQQNPYNGTAVWKNLASAIETNLNLPAASIHLDAKGTGFG